VPAPAAIWGTFPGSRMATSPGATPGSGQGPGQADCCIFIQRARPSSTRLHRDASAGSSPMSIAPATRPEEVRRVRHQARDAATLMVFSAALSVGAAAFFLVLAALAGRA